MVEVEISIVNGIINHFITGKAPPCSYLTIKLASFKVFLSIKNEILKSPRCRSLFVAFFFNYCPSAVGKLSKLDSTWIAL